MASAGSKVLELVVYKLNEGVSREQFLGTAGPVSKWLSQQPGFISHELSYDAGGDRWIDVVWWQTMEDAQTAAERAMSSEACAPMFALIDEETTLMVHGELAAPAAYADAASASAA